MGYIYKITNKITNKCYIGQTIQDPEKRWKAHKKSIESNGGCRALRESINKYGINNFTFNVLIICFDDDRLTYEKEYIKKYNSLIPNGYNILPGGQEGVLGLKHSEETKQKLSNIVKKRFENIEERKKASDNYKLLNIDNNLTNKRNSSPKWIKAKEEGRIGGKGIKKNIEMTESTKEKISESLKQYYKNNTNNTFYRNKEKWHEMLKNKKGSELVESHKNNISSGLIDYYTTSYKSFYDNVNKGEMLLNSHTTAICKYSLENKILNIYPSIAEASRIENIKSYLLGKVLRRKNNIYNNFIWKYCTEKELKEFVCNKDCGGIE